MTTATINGNRYAQKLKPKIKNKELLGIREKIALQVLKEKPEVETLKVVYQGKESKHFRVDFVEMNYL